MSQKYISESLLLMSMLVNALVLLLDLRFSNVSTSRRFCRYMPMQVVFVCHLFNTTIWHRVIKHRNKSDFSVPPSNDNYHLNSTNKTMTSGDPSFHTLCDLSLGGFTGCTISNVELCLSVDSSKSTST